MENEKIMQENLMIAKAKKQLNSMVLNDLEREYYERQKKAISEHRAELKEIESKWREIEDERENLEIEKAQFETEKLTIVKKLLETGANNEFISLVTQISEEEIEKLRKKLQ